MAFFLAFWSRRSTATVVSASSNSQARSRAALRRKSGYGSIIAVKRANAQDSRLIRKGTWAAVGAMEHRRSSGLRHPSSEHASNAADTVAGSEAAQAPGSPPRHAPAEAGAAAFASAVSTTERSEGAADQTPTLQITERCKVQTRRRQPTQSSPQPNQTQPTSAKYPHE